MSLRIELESIINEETRVGVIKLLRDLIKQTPVDTGRARANWQVSISGFRQEILTNNDRTGSSAINNAVGVISSSENVRYPTFYISNNLPYIEALNNGHSNQAPAKFVETSIRRFQNG